MYIESAVAFWMLFVMAAVSENTHISQKKDLISRLRIKLEVRDYSGDKKKDDQIATENSKNNIMYVELNRFAENGEERVMVLGCW